MGATCTAALIVGRTVYIGHVGNSRASLATEGTLRQLTNDHSAVGRLIQLGQLLIPPRHANIHYAHSSTALWASSQRYMLILCSVHLLQLTIC